MTSLENAVRTLTNTNHCLWVGAGTSIHLAGDPDLSWLRLVRSMEVNCGVESPPDGWGASLPERLDACLRTIGRVRFQQFLRNYLHRRIADSVVLAANRWVDGGEFPSPVRHLARLGQVTNPIVNFNIEMVTSVALACASPPVSIRSFHPPAPTDAGAGIGSTTFLPIPGRFARPVLHPHGNVETSGLCVMTETDYRSMNGTLAFQVAVHAAFKSDLAIVGMSLDDRYLRDQLHLFRRQIGAIRWFTPSASDEMMGWAWRNQVEIVTVSSDWHDFWEAVDALLPPVEQAALMGAYRIVGLWAFSEVNGSPFGITSQQTIEVMKLSMEQATDYRLASLLRGGSPVDPEMRSDRFEQHHRFSRKCAEFIPER